LYSFPNPGEPGGVFHPEEFYKLPSVPGLGVLKPLRLDDPLESIAGKLVPKSSKFSKNRFYPFETKAKDPNPKKVSGQSKGPNSLAKDTSQKKLAATLVNTNIVKSQSLLNGRGEDYSATDKRGKVPETALKAVSQSLLVKKTSEREGQGQEDSDELHFIRFTENRNNHDDRRNTKHFFENENLLEGANTELNTNKALNHLLIQTHNLHPQTGNLQRNDLEKHI